MKKKRWKEISEREVIELKHNQCKECMYFSKYSPSAIANATCDYIFIKGNSRGCLPTECVKRGVFILNDGRGKRRVGMTIERKL